jgi:hypothetical protein
MSMIQCPPDKGTLEQNYSPLSGMDTLEISQITYTWTTNSPKERNSSYCYFYSGNNIATLAQLYVLFLRLTLLQNRFSIIEQYKLQNSQTEFQ